MTPAAQVAAVGSELIARVGMERAQLVIRVSRETLEKLISEHGEEVASQVGLTLAILAKLNDQRPPTGQN